MINKIFTLISFFFIAATTVSAQNNVLIDKVIAKVGDEAIYMSELQEQVQYLKQSNRQFKESDICGVLNDLMMQSLMVNRATLDSVEIADTEVEAQLQSRIDRTLAMMNNNIAQFEEYYGKTVNEMKEELRGGLKNQLLAQRMQQTILEGVKVTPSEVKNFFKSIPKDSLPYFGSEVELAEIVIIPQVNDEQKQIARTKLEEIRKRIVENGEDFGDVAAKSSHDTGSARAKGSLGWNKRGTFVPEFEAVVYNSDIDEISEVFESEFGFHILQLQERRGNNVLVRHILIRPEITDEDIELAFNKIKDVKNQILSDSITFENAVKQYSSDKVQSYTNSGRMINPYTGNTFFQIDQLEPDEYFATDSLEINEITDPFPMTALDGTKAFKIVKLLTRTDPHVANLREDYTKIKMAAVEQQKSIFIETWLKENVTSTYIWIDPMYRDCPALEIWSISELGDLK